jgi:hypothetical protein
MSDSAAFVLGRENKGRRTRRVPRWKQKQGVRRTGPGRRAAEGRFFFFRATARTNGRGLSGAEVERALKATRAAEHGGTGARCTTSPCRPRPGAGTALVVHQLMLSLVPRRAVRNSMTAYAVTRRRQVGNAGVKPWSTDRPRGVRLVPRFHQRND